MGMVNSKNKSNFWPFHTLFATTNIFLAHQTHSIDAIIRIHAYVSLLHYISTIKVDQKGTFSSCRTPFSLFLLLYLNLFSYPVCIFDHLTYTLCFVA